MTINTRDALLTVTFLARAGYLAPAEGQADVWRDVINQHAPWATSDDAAAAARSLASQPHRWVATGDLIDELRRIRTEQLDAVDRRLRLSREQQPLTVTPPDRIRQILREQGVAP